MVKVVEVVVELEASGFINSDKVTRGRILRSIPDGVLSCEVDDGVRGATKPNGTFESVDDAKSALIAYWEKCNVVLQSHFWEPKSR
ncbi:hypothetical protein [Pseudomonas koreensis]|uniref:hypothetical protein n=1 Tax=Pseudomonas koreensis TaxID=198620 RepID=UPI002076EA65|nr:hypothetical protein [Pseudomonas koreensis]MCM8742363.1 hypothetical protein [Pseudomonas koreensis]